MNPSLTLSLQKLSLYTVRLVIFKTIIQQPTLQIPWDKDGQQGPDDPNNSLQILLNWLLKEGNHWKFRGGTDAKGMRKIDYGKSLSLQIKDAECYPRMQLSKKFKSWKQNLSKHMIGPTTPDKVYENRLDRKPLKI